MYWYIRYPVRVVCCLSAHLIPIETRCISAYPYVHLVYDYIFHRLQNFESTTVSVERSLGSFHKAYGIYLCNAVLRMNEECVIILRDAIHWLLPYLITEENLLSDVVPTQLLNDFHIKFSTCRSCFGISCNASMTTAVHRWTLANQ